MYRSVVKRENTNVLSLTFHFYEKFIGKKKVE